MSKSVNVKPMLNLAAGNGPVIVSGGGGDSAWYKVDENLALAATIQATPLKGRAALTYSIVGGADASKFVIDSATGKLSFVNAPDYEKPGDAGADNDYDVTVKVSDGIGSDIQAISIAVKNVNEAPTITSNGGTPEATIQVGENSSFVTTVTAQDPDAGSKLVHSIAGGADASKFTIDAATGALKFTAAPDYENPTDAGKDNTYDVIVKTSDGTLSDSQLLHVKVQDVVELSAKFGSSLIVSNTTELVAALKNARGGETIQLKAGDYSDLVLNANSGIPKFSSQVTIKSADPSNAAIFHNVSLSNIGNVKFDSLKFDYNAANGASLSTSPFKFTGCSGITVTNTQVTGDVARGVGALDDGFGTGRALVFLNSKNIEVSNNTISEFYRAAVFGNVTGLKVTGNNISNMSSDGLDFADVDNVVIDGNHIHDFSRNALSTAHPDMIQFWTTGTTSPSTNIVISNNFLDMGSGSSSQSIFMRNELVDTGKAGLEMYYQNVEISNNLIANQHNHGITVGATNGLVIDNNSLIQKVGIVDSQGAGAPGISVALNAVNVTITDNVAPRIDGSAGANWVVANNQIIQSTSPGGSSYAGNVYTDFLDKTASSLSDYKVVAGSILDGAGVGSTLTQISKTAGFTGFLQTADIGHGPALKQSFDASNLFLNGIKISLAGAKVVWDFGDKTLGSGVATEHIYTKPGTYEAKATITLADNKVVTIDKTITVVSDHLLNLDFNNSLVDKSFVANDFQVSGAALNGDVLRLNGGYVKYDADPNFFSNSEFSVLVDFKKDVSAGWKGGTLVSFSKMFAVQVTADGVQVSISTTKGPVTLSADKLGLANDSWHKLALTFSDEKGQASLYVDGKLAASAAISPGSAQLGVTSADFIVGGLGGGSFVGSVDNIHYLTEALTNKEAMSYNPITSWMAAGSQAAFAAPEAHHAVDVGVSVADVANLVSFPNDINLF